jgi:uncharacterized membrane protein YfcA
MLLELIGLVILVLVASSIGTLTGFGTSTIMVPTLLFFFPLPVTLLFAGIIHWFGDIWKMLFFRSGMRWRILLLFGVTGLIASYLGASLVVAVSEDILSRLLGVFLLTYVGWLTFNPTWQLPEQNATALTGGALSGFFAGIFGVGGAVRGAFLAAYNLPKEVYLFTGGAIALVVDSTRLVTYWSQGTRLSEMLLMGVLASIPASFAGAYLAKRMVDRIPQEQFRMLIAAFLALVALKLLLWP